MQIRYTRQSDHPVTNQDNKDGHPNAIRSIYAHTCDGYAEYNFLAVVYRMAEVINGDREPVKKEEAAVEEIRKLMDLLHEDSVARGSKKSKK